MAPLAKIHPFLVNSAAATRTLASACQDGNITIINLFPDEIDVRGPVWFMAIGTGQDVAAALGLLIGRQDIITTIAGSSASVLFGAPVNSIKVSSQHSTIDDV